MRGSCFENAVNKEGTIVVLGIQRISERSKKTVKGPVIVAFSRNLCL